MNDFFKLILHLKKIGVIHNTRYVSETSKFTLFPSLTLP